MARQCLVVRDWRNLAKILASNITGETGMQKAASRLFFDYASICLSLTDPILLQTLQQAAAMPHTFKRKRNASTRKEDSKKLKQKP